MQIVLAEALVLVLARVTLNSTIVAAIIGGVFLLLNGVMTHYMERERKAGRERRIVRLRILYGAALITGACALLALGSVTYLFESRAHQQVSSRERAAQDTCHLLRGLVIAAFPRTDAKRATALLIGAGLTDCEAYARRLVLHP